MTEPRPYCIIGGEPWWLWQYDYEFDGGHYSFEVCARSRDEADARLRKIALARFGGQVDGRPIPFHRGWLTPLLVWWRNWKQAQSMPRRRQQRTIRRRRPLPGSQQCDY